MEPSSTNNSSITPEQGEGTGTEVLSVSISQITSSSFTESPAAFSQRKSPSVMDSANAGHFTIVISSNKYDVVLMDRTGTPLNGDGLESKLKITCSTFYLNLNDFIHITLYIIEYSYS